ncbi:MAG: PhoH family protein [Treponema sp.]|jgi:phosphate starvation-inducible PhoH-like protein|nr:PhoH family protein [Treponema sp.]
MLENNRETIVLEDQIVLARVCGANDENLKMIESALNVRVNARGNEIRMEGDPVMKDKFRAVIDALIAAARGGETPSSEYVKTLAGDVEPTATAGAIWETVINIPSGRRVHPCSKNQAFYVRGMRENDISFCVGPAGTGKTYLAVAESLRLVLSKKLRKLVLTRPVVEAGESLGFLPGDLEQKINPYLRPLQDAMESLAPFETIRRLEETRAIEIAPLAYMRGRSLNDCAVILDEAQNTTKEQMKMFLTRIGQGSRVIVTGDVTQIDLPKRTESGLLHAASALKNIDGIYFAYLHTVDVVRNPLIKKIIQAYENYENEEK